MTNEIYADIRLRIDDKDDAKKFFEIKEHFGDKFDTEVLRKAIREAHKAIFGIPIIRNDKSPDNSLVATVETVSQEG